LGRRFTTFRVTNLPAVGSGINISFTLAAASSCPTLGKFSCQIWGKTGLSAETFEACML
jgi:hypothetical protein